MSARQRTLAIIKPDAVAKGVTGKIMARIEDAGFSTVAIADHFKNRFDVADGFLKRFNRPGEGIDIPVGQLAGETAIGLAIIWGFLELGGLVLAF